MNTHSYGFRLVGPCNGERRLVDAAAVFAAYADCDTRAKTDSEAYLSAFCFGGDFAEYVRRTGSPKGFGGSCWSPWLWFDIDNAADLEKAKADAAKLALMLCERYAIGEDDLLIFFSGSKGFHVGLPTAFFYGAAPSADFNRICRLIAERLAGLAGIAIDTGVYDQVRAFRAPNSRHPKTGRYKRHVPFNALVELSAAGIADLANAPEPFEYGDHLPLRGDWNPSADWHDAVKALSRQAEAKTRHVAAVADGTTAARLNQITLAFIRHGAESGDRHRLLYSAARNLAEFACPPGLAHAILTDSGLDAGLSPSEVRRQIDCGLKDGGTP